MAWGSSNFQSYMTTGHSIISLKLHGLVRLWHETDFSKSLQTFTFQTKLKMIKISWQSLILCQKFSINFFCFGIMLNGKFLLTIKWLVRGIASGSYNTCQKNLSSLASGSGFFVILLPSSACNLKCMMKKYLRKELLIELSLTFFSHNLIKAILCIMTTYWKKSIISPNFMVWKFCGKAQFLLSFGNLSEAMQKLCLSTKFPHQKIIGHYNIFCSNFYSTNKYFQDLEKQSRFACDTIRKDRRSFPKSFVCKLACGEIKFLRIDNERSILLIKDTWHW